MPAQTKTALLDVTRKERAKLLALLDRVPDDTALAKDGDDISIKDIVGHRAHWIDLFLGWWRDGQAGAEVHFPAPGYKWTELPRYNAALRATQADMGWPEARAFLTDRMDALETFIDGQKEDALYAAPMKGARNNWTTGRWAEAAGPSHYRSAAKYIRARLKG